MNFRNDSRDGFLDSLRRQILHDKQIRSGAGEFPAACAFVFAVRARENGNEYARLRSLDSGSFANFRLVQVDAEINSARRFNLRRENFFKRFVQRALNFVERNRNAVNFNLRRVNRLAEFGEVQLDVGRRLDNQTAVIFLEKPDLFAESESDVVANRHFGNRLGNSARANARRRNDFALANALVNRGKFPFQFAEIRHAVAVADAFHQINFAPRKFELRRNHAVRVHRRHCETHQRRRYVQLFVSAAHRVLAANRRHAESFLRLVRAKQCRERLAPLFGVVAQLLEVFLKTQIRL